MIILLAVFIVLFIRLTNCMYFSTIILPSLSFRNNVTLDLLLDFLLEFFMIFRDKDQD